ncbi:MAG TPA: rod shape-determining protein RodA [Gemmatimonadales bacterium]
MTRGIDSRLLIGLTALLAVGLTILFSAGRTDVPTIAAEVWKRQLVWLGTGSLLALIAFRLSPRMLEWMAPLLFGLGMLLLAVTLIVGTGAGTAAGTKSWLAIGGVRIGQPAEFAKLALIVMLARHLAGRRDAPAGLKDAVPVGVIVAIPFVLVGLQPDLGSALVFIGIMFAMLFWSGVAPSLLVLLASPLISLLLTFSTVAWGTWIVLLTLFILWVRPFVMDGLMVWLTNVAMGVLALELWKGLAPYQQHRLLSFLNPELDPRATGWHIIQSKVAIGSGGLLGKGFTAGTQKRLAFLPEQHTDFIFSVVGEEFGFVGVLACLALFALLILVLISIARRATDWFGSLVTIGVAGLLLTHLLVNVGMTVGLMPIMGIPLPFFSYGGSFLVTCLVALGIVARVSWEGRRSGYAGL